MITTEECKDMAIMLGVTLNELFLAAEKMQQETRPLVPMPRPHIFEICRSAYGTVEWPDTYNKNSTNWNWNAICTRSPDKSNRNTYRSYNSPEVHIIRYCDYQPRQILRALRRIQAATAWCEARTEGRKRAAEEILRQQQAAVDALEAEAILGALK